MILYVKVFCLYNIFCNFYKYNYASDINIYSKQGCYLQLYNHNFQAFPTHNKIEQKLEN